MTSAGSGWRRSSFCSDGTCVEVAIDDTAVLIRHSMDPDVRLTLSHSEWRALVEGIRADEFEVPEQGE